MVLLRESFSLFWTPFDREVSVSQPLSQGLSFGYEERSDLRNDVAVLFLSWTYT